MHNQNKKSKQTCKEARAASLSLSFCSCSSTKTDLGSKTNLPHINFTSIYTISSHVSKYKWVIEKLTFGRWIYTYLYHRIMVWAPPRLNTLFSFLLLYFASDSEPTQICPNNNTNIQFSVLKRNYHYIIQ